MKLENISSIRALMHHRPEFNNFMRVNAQASAASSSARCKAVFYTPARNLLGRIRVVFSGAGARRQRAIDRLNTVISLCTSLPKGAGETLATQHAVRIAFSKYSSMFFVAGMKERAAMVQGLIVSGQTKQATISIMHLLACLKPYTKEVQELLEILSAHVLRQSIAGDQAPLRQHESVTSSPKVPPGHLQQREMTADQSGATVPASPAVPDSIPPVVEVRKHVEALRTVAPAKLQGLLDIAADLVKAIDIMAATPVPASS